LTRPFLKWPGGKRWLVPRACELLEGLIFTRYVEPFLGGGAMYFGLRPANAILVDINRDLINVYKQVQADPTELIDRLKRLPVDAEEYERIRVSLPMDPVDAAVRFLYLNRTAFGGMYRLNRQGQFNVPFGGGQRTPAPLWRDRLLAEASSALEGAVIRVADFEETLAEAGAGDLVYCDPTYTVAHNNNGFVRYNERNFSWADQKRLARVCSEAAGRGAFVLVSNAVHDEIEALYPNAELLTVSRWSRLSPRPHKRQRTSEALFVFRPPRAAPRSSDNSETRTYSLGASA
jgi:DNA adenine methylase